jgi:hypothetical protein
MDMDQYERMLDFMGLEVKRNIAVHEQKEHFSGKSLTADLLSQLGSARVMQDKLNESVE